MSRIKKHCLSLSNERQAVHIMAPRWGGRKWSVRPKCHAVCVTRSSVALD